MFHISLKFLLRQGMLTPVMSPFLAMQIEMIPVSGVCAFAAGDMLAIRIAAADAPTSQRHACLKD
jgi:hypothetical protein